MRLILYFTFMNNSYGLKFTITCWIIMQPQNMCNDSFILYQWYFCCGTTEAWNDMLIFFLIIDHTSRKHKTNIPKHSKQHDTLSNNTYIYFDYRGLIEQEYSEFYQSLYLSIIYIARINTSIYLSPYNFKREYNHKKIYLFGKLEKCRIDSIFSHFPSSAYYYALAY